MENALASKKLHDLLKRALVALVGIPLVFLILTAGPWVFLATGLVMAGIMTFEWQGMFVQKRRPNQSKILFISGFFYIYGAIGWAIYLAFTPVPSLNPLMWLFFIVWATDIGAYFAGRLIGGPKLLPAVSPKKTWSGFVGGVGAAIIIGHIFSSLLGFQKAPFFMYGRESVWVLSFFLSVISQCGDLIESAVKRYCEVKDSGGLLPGHGGFLDRFDGFLAAAWGLGLMHYYSGRF